MMEVKTENIALFLGQTILISLTLFLFSSMSYAEYCPYSTEAYGGTKGPCINDGKGKQSSNSQANTQAMINIATQAAQMWDEERKKQDAIREAQYKKDEEKRKQTQAQENAEYNLYLKQLKNSPDTNPWANLSKSKNDKKDKPELTDTYLGTCVEQNYSMRSDGQFALKNTCNYPINLKYTISSSKPFSGTYSTLQPNQVTFETGTPSESVTYTMCKFPQVPQSLNGGCI